MLTTSNWTNGLWHGYSDALRKKFGEKVYKVTVHAGFTCPTRDGTKGSEGCAFCDERGSSSFYASGQASKEIRNQILSTIPQVQKRFSAKKCIAYFQAYTNTYGPISYLQEIYDSALNIEDVVGLSIGTRPDCVPHEILQLLNQYGSGGRYIHLEVGLQSIRNEALDFYMRGHSVEEGIEGIKRALLYKNLQVTTHLMFGAPGDTIETAIESAKLMNELGIHGVKIHQLMILKNTVLAKRFAIEPWKILSMEEYNEMAIAFLEHLDPKIYVERTHALSSHPEELVAPSWSAGRFAPQNNLRNEMIRRKTFQGRLFPNASQKVLH